MPETNLKPHFSNYNRREPFPQFQQPRMIDGFCLEQDRSFNHSRKYLKYLRLPKTPLFDFDLNVGYENYVPGPKEVNITSVLQFIGKTEEGRRLIDRSGNNRLAADFVCYRGLLTQIFNTPYFSRDPWTVLATKYRGTIYLCNYVSPEKMKMYEEKDTEYSTKCSYYGKNFERFVLTGDPTAESIPTPTDPLKDTEEFNVALTTKLNGWRILYAAELDGVEEVSEAAKSTPLDLLKFVEVKTRAKDTTEQQYRNYLKWKLPKWWCQSFLVGVDTIHVGFRSRDGHVREMEKLSIHDIPKMCEGVWSPSVMVRFGADFLSTVQDAMHDIDCPHTVFKFDYDNNKSWNITYSVIEGPNDLSFLPQTHIDLLTK